MQQAPRAVSWPRMPRPRSAGQRALAPTTACSLTVCRIMSVRPGCTASMESATSCAPCLHTNSARKTSSDLRQRRGRGSAAGGWVTSRGEAGAEQHSRGEASCYPSPALSPQPHRVNLAVRDDCRRLNSRPQMVGMYCGRQKGAAGQQDRFRRALLKSMQLSPDQGAGSRTAPAHHQPSSGTHRCALTWAMVPG